MSSDSTSQQDLKANVKRWLKARGLDYKWLAEQCFVTEVTIYNWMAKKKIPDAKEHIIRSLMAQMPINFPQVKVETESRVILQLPHEVQKSLEEKALAQGMTVTDFLAEKINEIVRDTNPSKISQPPTVKRVRLSTEDD